MDELRVVSFAVEARCFVRLRRRRGCAGGVIVWDRGTWVTLADDPLEALTAGELKFRLAGEKLRGGWTLVRIAKDPKNWLFIKERDDEVRPLAEYDVLVEEPLSVLSGVAVEDFVKAEEPGAKPAAPRVKPERIRGAKAASLPCTSPARRCASIRARRPGGG